MSAVAVDESPGPAALSGVAEAVHIWSGQGEALLVLTQHGALLERPGAGETWVRLGRLVDGAEAQRIADQRGYDHVGFDSTIDQYVPPGVVLAMVPEVNAEGARMVAQPQAGSRPNQAIIDAARRRNKALAKLWRDGGDLAALEAKLGEYAASDDLAYESVRKSLVVHLKDRGQPSPWGARRSSAKAGMVPHYERMYERQKAGEQLRAVALEVATETGRKVDGILQTFNTWRQEAGLPPVTTHGGPRPSADRRPKLAAVPAEAALEPAEPASTSVQVRALLGVAAVAGEDRSEAAVDHLRDTVAELGRALEATWRALPTAKAIVEHQIEELMQRLEDLEAEGKRITAAAAALGIELPAP